MSDNCDLSLMEHVDGLIEAMAEAGIGGGCENSYRSLVELAEACRLANGFDVYMAELTHEIIAADGSAEIVH